MRREDDEIYKAKELKKRQGLIDAKKVLLCF